MTHILLPRSVAAALAGVACFAAFGASSSKAQVVDPPAGTTIEGELVDPSLFGSQVVETMEEVVERDRYLRANGLLRANPRPNVPRWPPSHAPQAPAPGGTSAPVGPSAFPGTSSLLPGPNFINGFVGPRLGDPGANAFPPDTCGAVGINHFVAITNANISVYVKSTGARVLNVSQQSFWGASLGDGRATFDPASQRFILMSDDFNTRVFIAVSATSDPTGAWFKTNVTLSAGSDAGHWPDYPTLGVDANGVYIASYMVGGANTMSIFALDKAPLVAPVQSLGTVTAFRGKPYEDAIQPCVTWSSAAGEYLISRQSSAAIRVRRINPPLSAPTLTELGTVSHPNSPAPPSAPQLGGTQRLDALDGRHMNAVFRNGSIWTTNGISSSSRGAVRWYQIGVSPSPTLTQTGLLADPVIHFTFPSICVDGAGNVLVGFTATSGSMFAGAYVAGRQPADPPGTLSAIAQLKAGDAYYDPNVSDPERWGDYSLTSADPVDDTLWTIQEYARTGNDWGTWIGHYGSPCSGPPDCNGNGINDTCDLASGVLTDINANGTPDQCEGLNAAYVCRGDGGDPDLTTICPCFNLGDLNHGCGNSIDAAGGFLRIFGTTSPDSLAMEISHVPPTTNMTFVKANATNTTGIAFGDGIRCITGSQIRFGSQTASGGLGYYPNTGDPPISVVGGTPPGSGQTAYYQVFYRNADPTFCTVDTFNMTNGLRIVW